MQIELVEGTEENIMVLMVDTTTKHIGKAIAEELLRSGENSAGFELLDTAGMRI